MTGVIHKIKLQLKTMEQINNFLDAQLILARLGYPLELGLKQINQESRFKAHAISKAGAKGIAQFMPDTWRYCYNEAITTDIFKRANVTPVNDPFDHKTALVCYVFHMSVQIPKQLAKLKYKDTHENRLRAYNAGAGNVFKSRKFKETNEYVKIILNPFVLTLTKQNEVKL